MPLTTLANPRTDSKMTKCWTGHGQHNNNQYVDANMGIHFGDSYHVGNWNHVRRFSNMFLF